MLAAGASDNVVAVIITPMVITRLTETLVYTKATRVSDLVKNKVPKLMYTDD